MEFSTRFFETAQGAQPFMEIRPDRLQVGDSFYLHKVSTPDHCVTIFNLVEDALVHVPPDHSISKAYRLGVKHTPCGPYRRLKFFCPDGAWHGYLFPHNGLILLVDSNGFCETIKSELSLADSERPLEVYLKLPAMHDAPST